MLAMSNHGETYHGIWTLHRCSHVVVLLDYHQFTDIRLGPRIFKISHYIALFKFILSICYSIMLISLSTNYFNINHIHHSIKTITLNVYYFIFTIIATIDQKLLCETYCLFQPLLCFLNFGICLFCRHEILDHNSLQLKSSILSYLLKEILLIPTVEPSRLAVIP